MRFYSYNYLLDQIARFDWWGAAFTIFLIICLIITMFKYHQKQKETKFRELAIILGLGIVIVICIKISQYRVTQANDNHYRQAVHFIEVVLLVPFFNCIVFFVFIQLFLYNKNGVIKLHFLYIS